MHSKIERKKRQKGSLKEKFTKQKKKKIFLNFLMQNFRQRRREALPFNTKQKH